MDQISRLAESDQWPRNQLLLRERERGADRVEGADFHPFGRFNQRRLGSLAVEDRRACSRSGDLLQSLTSPWSWQEPRPQLNNISKHIMSLCRADNRLETGAKRH